MIVAEEAVELKRLEGFSAFEAGSEGAWDCWVAGLLASVAEVPPKSEPVVEGVKPEALVVAVVVDICPPSNEGGA